MTIRSKLVQQMIQAIDLPLIVMQSLKQFSSITTEQLCLSPACGFLWNQLIGNRAVLLDKRFITPGIPEVFKNRFRAVHG